MEESRPAVLAAIVANLAIATMKFFAAAFSGSSAMLSEGIHSLVDTGDGILLWVGMSRSRRPPDDRHPFGHGKELYFWTLVVAVLVFAVGGGMSVYEGIGRLAEPHATSHGVWTYAVLGGAAAFEGASWLFAWRSFTRARRGRGIWETIETGKDPTSFAVLFEDSAALVSLVVAFVGIWLSQRLGSSIPDGVASIAIGAILMTIAVLLVRATLRLLVGQSADPKTVAKIRDLVASEPNVTAVGRVLTMHLGPDDVLVQVSLAFAQQLDADGVARTIDRLQERLRRSIPSLKHVFLEADSVSATAPGS